MIDTNYSQVAQEGLFTKKKSVDDLLATAKKHVAKLKSVEEVDAKLQAVNESGKAVNAALRSMSDAAKKRASGKIDDKTFRSQVASASKSISAPIKAVYAKLGNVVENKNSVTSDEIKAFQQYLNGLKKLLMDRKKSLKSSPVKESYEDIDMDDELKEALEALDEALENSDFVMEGCGKCTESDDEDCDDECDTEDSCDECEDDDEEDDEDDDAEEACGESFSAKELRAYSSACESMIDSEFEEYDDSVSSILNDDGTLIF